MQPAPDVDARARSRAAGHASPRGFDRAVSVLLGLGTAWTTATQLRAGGVLGMGEAVLALWLPLALTLVLVGGAARRTPLRTVFLLFWAVSLASLAVGWSLAIWGDVWAPGTERDAIAFLLSALVTAVFLLQPAPETRVGPVVWAYLVGLVGPVLVMLALAATGRFMFGPVNTLYERARFTAWSLNPNQLALACAALPFLAMRLRRTTRGASRAALTALLVGVGIVGAATLSDALVLAWAAAGGLLLAGRWVALVRTRRGVGRKAFAFFGVPLLALATAVAIGPTIAELADERLVASYNEGGQGSDRIGRWRNGLEAMDESPVFGLGPGSYSGPAAPFGGQEAHNSVVDWGMSTGLLGTLAYAVLLAAAARACLAARDHLALAGLVALFAFTMFHYAFRQPVFWMQLVLLAAPHAHLVLARPARTVAVRPAVAEG